MDNLLGIAVAVMGVLVLFVDFMAFVYRKLTEGIGLCWFFFGGVLILLGIVPGLSEWTKAVPVDAYPALALFGVMAAAMAFYFSCKLSQLLRKNQELAMHVSLLNQENESILGQLKELRELKHHEDSVRH